MPVSEATYQRVALEDGDEVWELVCGRLRKKPLMTTEHDDLGGTLQGLLFMQVRIDEYSVRSNSGRLRVTPEGPAGQAGRQYYVPDVCVIPRALVNRLKQQPGTFEVYDDPLPLVVEIWSPSTGEYDVTAKLAEYQRRKDEEIWLIHPYERTLTAWRRQTGGWYREMTYRTGEVSPAALPGVVVNLDTLFGT